MYKDHFVEKLDNAKEINCFSYYYNSNDEYKISLCYGLFICANSFYLTIDSYYHMNLYVYENYGNGWSQIAHSPIQSEGFYTYSINNSHKTTISGANDINKTASIYHALVFVRSASERYNLRLNLYMGNYSTVVDYDEIIREKKVRCKKGKNPEDSILWLENFKSLEYGESLKESDIPYAYPGNYEWGDIKSMRGQPIKLEDENDIYRLIAFDPS